MVQGCEQLRFTFEARDPFRILRKRGRQAFDGHTPIESRVSSAIDLAHSSGTKRAFNFIGTDPRPGLNRHVAEPGL
jgi:hypothetical protein